MQHKNKTEEQLRKLQEVNQEGDPQEKARKLTQKQKQEKLRQETL